jgi:HD-like signal output (HDOD) protein
MPQKSTIQQFIDQRFDQLFIDVKEALLNASFDGEKAPTVIELEQSKTIRSLLRVEKQAIREKHLNKKLEQSHLNEIRSHVDVEVEERLIESLKDVDTLYHKVLQVDEKLPELLDVLSMRAATISKIQLAAEQIPWLFQDLIKMVNMPKYQRIDNRGKVVVVDSLRVALNFFGIDNLKPVILSLAMRRWLPQITDPYPQIKISIRDQSMVTAMACKQIASLSKVDEAQAFSLGMLHIVGKVIIVRMYFKLFETVRREALIEAQVAQKNQDHLALARIEPSGEFLSYLLEELAMPVSSAMIDKMNLRRLFITNAMQEFANHTPLEEMSAMGRVLYQGHAYAKYRMLKANKLIDVQQSKDFLRTLSLPTGALELLKITDVRSLNLVLENK